MLPGCGGSALELGRLFLSSEPVFEVAGGFWQRHSQALGPCSQRGLRQQRIAKLRLCPCAQVRDYDSKSSPMEFARPRKPLAGRRSASFLREDRNARQEPRAPAPGKKVMPRVAHKLLKVAGGSQGGRKLLSPADQNVRPMMEVVKAAVFSMLQTLSDSPAGLPAGSRWLDLYSGTGAVGIEGLSRGCASAHFVELDSWVIDNVLRPNLDATGFACACVVHRMKVETLLARAEEGGGAFVGGPFDYVSVTPPYEAVVYTDLMAQLARSPLISPSTCIVVEYPLEARHEMPEMCGPLAKIRDRRYGRTNVALYASPEPV